MAIELERQAMGRAIRRIQLPNRVEIVDVAPDRPRLLIVCEFERDGEQYALELGLPQRAAFEVITNGHRLQGRTGGIYRTVALHTDGGAVLPPEIYNVLNRAVAAGRLRAATDEDVAAVIAAWRG